MKHKLHFKEMHDDACFVCTRQTCSVGILTYIAWLDKQLFTGKLCRSTQNNYPDLSETTRICC